MKGMTNAGLALIYPSLGSEVSLGQGDVTGNVHQRRLDSIKLPYFISAS
jgi:hypothetical protein